MTDTRIQGFLDNCPDADWLQSVGFRRFRPEWAMARCEAHGPTHTFTVWADGGVTINEAKGGKGIEVPAVKTRADVLAWCRLLQIPTKGGDA